MPNGYDKDMIPTGGTDEWALTKVHHGLTPMDWSVLFPSIRKPDMAKRTLDAWISTGYLTKLQARDIWNEMSGQLVPVLYSWTLEGIRSHKEEIETRDKAAAERARWEEGQRTYFPSYAPVAPKPFTEYGPGLEEMRTGFAGGIPQTERWRDWFRSKYPRLIEQFEAKVPEAERKEKTWAEYLKKRKPEVREEWYGMTPYERGERPSAFAPRIQTVGF